MPHPVELLRKLFNLSPELLEKLSAEIKEKRMPKGSAIDGNKNVQQNTYYIKKGAARAYYTKDGKEHTMSFAFDDEYLMTHLVLNSIDIPLSIKFMKDSEVICIPIRSLSYKMKKEADSNLLEASMFLNSSLVAYNSYLEERIYTLQCMDARERYDWAMRRYPRLLEYATVTQVASFLGVTRETLYRIRSGKY